MVTEIHSLRFLNLDHDPDMLELQDIVPLSNTKVKKLYVYLCCGRQNFKEKANRGISSFRVRSSQNQEHHHDKLIIAYFV